MSRIKTYTPDTQEYKNLKLFADMLNYSTKNGTEYTVCNTYFDYGQDWKWTTIIGRSKDSYGGYQALTPRLQEAVLDASSVKELTELIDEYFAGDFCLDK